MRGGKREGSGRKKLDHIQKTIHIEKKNFYIIENIEGKTFSEKLNNYINSHQ
jgi:hypothetical protein